MKSLFISFFTCLVFLTSAQDLPNSKTVLTVEGENISVEEFLQGYHKNKTDKKKPTKEELDEYLELFVNFRLKVKEAESLGLDTLSTFIKEYEGYKNQLTESYLVDKEVSNSLIKEAYDRMQQEVKASHILIDVAPDAIPEDTLEVYNRILKVRDRALKGESFEDLAKEFSKDPSAKKNGGNLGYFSALKMVYPFETAAYNTKVGDISMPIRTRFGYHIIKVVDKRKSTGEWKAAHIMVKTAKDGSEEAMKTAEKLISEIYEKVVNGDDFGNLARTYSDDAATRRKGGVLPWFRSNTYPEIFEKNCFGLSNDGDYSKPFKTDYGFHIVKRIEVRENPSFEDSKSRIERKVSKDSRSKVTKKVTYQRLLKEYSYKDYSKNLKFVYPAVDTTFFTKDWSYNVGSKGKKKLFELDGKSFTVSDFLIYLGEFNGKRKKGDLKVVTYTLFEKWKEEITFNYERSQLGSKYPEYTSLLKEYKNGILLFNLMEQKVWNKAINDTLGLDQFFADNQKDYMWKERKEVEIYACDSDSSAKEVYSMLEANADVPSILEKLNKNSELKVRLRQGVYENDDEEILSKVVWNDQWISKPVLLNDKYYVTQVNELIPAGPKKIEDSKGIVIADYQNFLDKEWIKVLRSKYSFQVNEANYNSIFK